MDCRINYDDYVNFEIEVLTPEEINEYKAKELENTTELLKRLQFLKAMLEEENRTD